MKVVTGLDRLITERELQQKIKGNISYLCHSASITGKLESGVLAILSVFGKRVVSLMGPQHGFVSDVQDNMIETDDFIHPYFKIPVYSLYSETRSPTDHMLENVDCLIIDLQDVGTRIYTYITTVKLILEKCAQLEKQVIILDRPNPINGVDIEGNILEDNYLSFVGASNIAVRHGMTIGEMALFFQKKYNIPVDLHVISMKNWKRQMYFDQTSLPWVMPSPNMPTLETALCFPGTVLFEGTNISEGRGTTHSLEILGHPNIEPFRFVTLLQKTLNRQRLTGFVLRPCSFVPTFQKHQHIPCGGFQIHITDREKFRPWRVAQIILREMIHELGDHFDWKAPPYEYEFEKLPIDLINGTAKIRHWAMEGKSLEELEKIEQDSMDDFLRLRSQSLLY